jgi:glutamate racemase
MVKIVVFDSGMGSLSIIKPLQKTTKSEIIYFADRKNFPYGKKSKSELGKIIKSSLRMLNEQFNPDLIIIGSNTPTLLLKNLTTKKIIGILPPLKQAAKTSKTKNIAIFATRSVCKSKELSNYIKKNHLSKKINVLKINASPLIELVESGKFISKKNYCIKKIKGNLDKILITNNIDVVTLSSTHLPFLSKILQKEYPKIHFLDPGYDTSLHVAKLINRKK